MTAKIINEFRFLEQSSEILKSIAHPVRLGIMSLLFEHKNMTVTAIQKMIDIEQAVTSYHLKIMKDSGIVEVKREGKCSFYKLKEEKYHNIINTLVDINLKSI